ncbi:hypothetical protein ABZ639_21085 [Saccharomonospora sp. NPDC006951]
MAGRPSPEAVARWNNAYAEQTAALFAAMRSGDVAAVRRLSAAYHAVAQAWRVLSGDYAAPLWARHAATIAAEEFELRARLEAHRADLIQR